MALAPTAVRAPIAPTMKYWKTKLLFGFLSLRYLLKSGILVVLLLPMPRKGESNESVVDATHLLDEVESARTGREERDVRGRVRSRVREVEEREAMVLDAGCGQLVDGGWIEVVSLRDFDRRRQGTDDWISLRFGWPERSLHDQTATQI